MEGRDLAVRLLRYFVTHAQEHEKLDYNPKTHPIFGHSKQLPARVQQTAAAQ